MKTSTHTTTRNWIVNDLLGCERVALSWEKTRKTSNFFRPPTVCATRCLITSMRDTTFGNFTNYSAVCGTERTVRGQREGVEILGTSITCSGTKESRAVRNDNSLVHRLRHRNIERVTPTRHRQPGPRSAAVPTPAPHLQQRCWPLPRVKCVLSPWGFGRLEHLTLSGFGACPPGSLERRAAAHCDVLQRPGPCGWTAVHGATTNAASALSFAARLHWLWVG